MADRKQHIDTIFADLASDKKQLRSRQLSQIRAYRNASDGGMPPTTQIRNYLTRVLINDEPFGDLAAKLESNPKWAYGKKLSVFLGRTLTFLSKFDGEFVKPQTFGAFDVPHSKIRGQFFPHATFREKNVVTDIIVYSTSTVTVSHNYWGAFNALANYVADVADKSDHRIIIFDAIQNVWMRAANDPVHLDALLLNRQVQWKNLVIERGISDPVDEKQPPSPP